MKIDITTTAKTTYLFYEEDENTIMNFIKENSEIFKGLTEESAIAGAMAILISNRTIVPWNVISYGADEFENAELSEDEEKTGAEIIKDYEKRTGNKIDIFDNG